MVTVGGVEKGDSEPILAECLSCGLPFVAGTIGPSGMALGHGQDTYIGYMSTGPTGISMQNVQVQCNRCGSMGRVPDGVYSFVRRSREVLRQLTPQQTATLVAAIRRYQAGEADEAEVEAATPEKARPFVLETMGKVDKRYWFGVVLAVLIFLASWHMSDDSTSAIEHGVAMAEHQQTEQDRQVEECIAAMMAQVDAQQGSLQQHLEVPRQHGPATTPRAVPPATTFTPPSVLPNKNDPCWCGSGRKFMRCHRVG